MATRRRPQGGGYGSKEDQGCNNKEEEGSLGISGKDEDNLHHGNEELGLGGITSTSNLLGE